MKLKLKLGRRTYYSIFADGAHDAVDDISEIRKYDDYQMGLFFGDGSIGDAILMRWRGGTRYRISRDPSWLQTESTGLYRGRRRKGHGIALYICLIETARAIGATRIYSSRNLNKLSRRMWAKKLGRYYNVQTRQTRCECGRNDKKKPVYFIDLGEPIPNGISIHQFKGNRLAQA